MHTSLEQLAGTSLGLPKEWSVESLEWEKPGEVIRVRLSPVANAAWRCPICDEIVSIYDTLQKSWRHLDLWTFETWVHAHVPRLNCPNHGVRATRVPWAEPGSRLTRPMTDRAMTLLRTHRVATTSTLLGLSWDQLKRLKKRMESAPEPPSTQNAD